MLEQILHTLRRMERKLDALLYQGVVMSKEMDDLVSQVHKNTDTEDSIDTALAGIKAQLDAAIANGADPAVLKQLSADLEASRQKMVAAILANTPAAPPAP